MKTIRTVVFIIAAAFTLGVCSSNSLNVRDPDVSPEWFRGSTVVSDDGSIDLKALDDSKIDLVYLVSTEVLSARDSNGTAVYQSALTPADRQFIDGEMAFAEKNFSKGDFNFLAPYYHQYTFEAITLPTNEYSAVFDGVKKEVNGIIDYYLAYVNNGRKFALVGFSQGAMLVVEALKHCKKEELKNMVGAYVIGCGINDDDLKCRNIIPASGEYGFGHTVSFNSVMTADATWPFVYNNASTAINPLNWSTDSTPATMELEGQKMTVTLDSQLHELIVDIPDKTPFHEFMNTNPAYKMAGVSPDCLHRWDLLFYTQQIHDNIINRAMRP